MGVFERMRRISLGWMAVMALGFVLTGGVYDDAAGVEKCGGFISCGNPYSCCDNGSDEDGNCTWWAWKMMADRWGFKAKGWGMAGQEWIDGAKAEKLPTGETPHVGAIFVRVSDSGVGQVGYVIDFSKTSISATEMCCVIEDTCEQYTDERNDYRKYSWPDDNFLGFIYPPDGSGPVPNTGVRRCYDDSGNEISPCPDRGERFYGQDGNFYKPLSYTKLDASGKELSASATSWAMVRDNMTGLIWEAKTDDGSIHDKDNRYSWYDAWDTFIFGLNDAKFGGNCDWRLPTIKEVAYLVDHSIPYREGPTINTTYFPNTVSNYYWSSTTYASGTSYAWCVDFYDGGGWGGQKSLDYYVRAVRVGQ